MLCSDVLGCDVMSRAVFGVDLCFVWRCLCFLEAAFLRGRCRTDGPAEMACQIGVSNDRVGVASNIASNNVGSQMAST